MPEAGSESTQILLERARRGERSALDTLLARYLSRLQRWASGRLPRWARNAMDTHDLVQDVIVQTLKHIDTFEPRGEGALQAYLRQAVLNRIRNEIRGADRRPAIVALDEETADREPSPLESAIGQQALERYERGLSKLREEDREAIIAKVELGCDYRELAGVLGKPSADAARKAVERALVRLAQEMSLVG